MNKKFLLLAPVVALLLAGCGGGSKTTSSTQTSSQESQQTSEQSSEVTSTSSTSSKEQSSEQSSEQTSSKEEQSSSAESSQPTPSSESSEDLPSSEEQQSSEELPSSEEKSSEELPSSEEESSEPQSSVEPVGDTYFVQIGEAAPIPLTAGDGLGLAEGQTGQYSAEVYNVFAGESITFFFNSDVITNFGSDLEDEENKNLFQVVEGVYLAHNDVEETTIYFKTWQDGGYSFWATGYEKGEEPPVEDTTYYVQVGEGNLVELVKDEECSLILGQTGQYVAGLENLVKDEKVVFYADDTAITTGIGSDPEDAENKNLIRTIEGEFVINNDAAASTIYFKTWEDGGYSFWATGYEKGEEPPADIPEEDGYYVVGTKTGWKYEGAVKMGAGEGDDLAQLIGYEATAGEELKVRGYHDEVDTWYQIADMGPYDNYVVSEDCLLDIYLNKDGVTFIAVEHDPVDTMTLTITNYPADKEAEHYVVHAWGGIDAAKNYEATLVGTTLTVSVPQDITGFLVAAYDGAFDWDNLVYKSPDFTITEGVTEYALPDIGDQMTLTITGIPNQYQSADYDLYVYYWGSAEGNDFVPATVTGDFMTADVPQDITGFLVVIMAHGYTPAWSGTGFVAQSVNYPYSAGTVNYTWANLK